MLVEGLATHRATYPSRRGDYGPKIASLLEAGTEVSSVDYYDAVRHQQVFRRELLSLFREVDALAMPSTEVAAPGLDTTGTPNFQSPWSYTGWPEVTIPCGLTSEGLPAGLQLVGAPWSEAALLGTAAWCERVLNFTARPALLD
jgi:Asp-tRNA(Asn)/Glu-tRNA(Gln) amidotransferase A subunit family amidase